MSRQSTTQIAIIGLLSCWFSSQSALAQGRPPVLEDKPVRTTYKIAPASMNAPATKEPAAATHPLIPLVKLAEQQYNRIRSEVSDYTCVLVKRERFDGELRPSEHHLVKFRGHRVKEGTTPIFSVYTKAMAPKSIKNREALFVEGQYDEEMLVTKGGRRNPTMTFKIRPHGRMAMRDTRYPITEFGIENLLARVMEVAAHDMQYDECEVRAVRGAKVDKRLCTMYEVKHPHERAHFAFHLARIFVDDELQLPVCFAAYTWPETEGADPLLVEQYTFRNLEFNVGLTDEDFKHNNGRYKFSIDSE